MARRRKTPPPAGPVERRGKYFPLCTFFSSYSTTPFGVYNCRAHSLRPVWIGVDSWISRPWRHPTFPEDLSDESRGVDTSRKEGPPFPHEAAEGCGGPANPHVHKPYYYPYYLFIKSFIGDRKKGRWITIASPREIITREEEMRFSPGARESYGSSRRRSSTRSLLPPTFRVPGSRPRASGSTRRRTGDRIGCVSPR